MKLLVRTSPFSFFHGKRFFRFVSVLALGCLLGSSAQAQAPVGTQPSSPLPPLPKPSFGTSVLSGGYVPEFLPVLPLQWGSVAVHPHFAYSLSYGKGIQSRPGDRSSSTIQSFSPGVTLNFGTSFIFDYTATQTFYSNDDFQNRLRHSVSLSASRGYGRWGFNFSQGYTSASEPLVETGRQTSYESFTTSLGATYALGDRTSINSGLDFSLGKSDTGPETRTTTWSEGISYQLTSRVNVGVNAELGSSTVSAGEDMEFARAHVMLGWQPTEKISFNVQTGAERRRFIGSDVPDMSTPTYSGGASYRPFSTTVFSLSGSRGVSASFFTSQVVENTTWSLSASQRLLGRFSLGANYSVRNADYTSTSSAFVTGRNDRNRSFGLSLGTGIFSRGSIGISYSRNQNDSNLNTFGFTSEQYGLNFSYRY